MWENIIVFVVVWIWVYVFLGYYNESLYWIWMISVILYSILVMIFKYIYIDV